VTREPKTYLWDARDAADAIIAFTRGKSAADYVASKLLRSAVERQFAIIGEALSQLAKLDRAVAAQIPDLPRVIGLRNILVHGYAVVDDDIVWRIVQGELPGFRAVLDTLLRARGDEPS
jgi:uncharacterized protein with HEPN domain